KDINNNYNRTEKIDLEVFDVTLPVLSGAVLGPDSQVNATGSDYTNVSVSVSELELDSVYANLSPVDGVAEAYLVLHSDGKYYHSFIVLNSVNSGYYNISVFANDTSGNTAEDIVTIVVNDTIAPGIIFNSPVNNFNYSSRSNLINISTDEISNVSYKINVSDWIELYNESVNGAVDLVSPFKELYWQKGYMLNLSVRAVDEYGRENVSSVIFWARPDLNMTDISSSGVLSSGYNITVNATLNNSGFPIGEYIVRFYCSDNPSVPFAINNYSSIGADSEIEIESNGSWVAKSGTYNLSAVVSVSDDRMSGDGEATLENNDIFLEIVIEDFTLNSSVIDFGTLNVGSSLLRSVSLSNTGLVNQKNVVESASYWKYFNQTETFTKLENKTYYFTRPQNVSYNDLDVGLTYNTSRGTVRTYIDSFSSGSSGFSKLVLEVIEMESSPLYVEAYVKMPISVLSDMNSSFPTSSVTIYNLSSEVYNYDLVLPSGLGYGTFGGNVTYSNANDSASFNTSFVSNAAELLIRTNYSDVPVVSENGSLTFYADPDW
ncbi:MAG: hypothetical protein KAJ54_03105, partial [Candidatus Aenigmarchaeota archaeon]|nr:hypothetical protein [Candidatus Aenigmarchaeota archaeon]